MIAAIVDERTIVRSAIRADAIGHAGGYKLDDSDIFADAAWLSC